MTSSPLVPRKSLCLWKRAVRVAVLVALVMAGLLVGCQNRLIYFPQPYEHNEPAGFLQRGGSRIDFTTGEGHQTAWLIPPRDGATMERLWIVCNGNASTALGMESWSRALPFRKDAFLLFDYPGYGACEGSPHPSRIRESLHTVIPLAAKQLRMTDADLHESTCVFGHSLGAAAALIAVEEFHFRRAVLVSPFTSTMEMARVKLKLPLGFLVWHRFDNRTGLACMKEYNGHAWIFHGTADSLIPVEMSRTLAAEFPGVVTLQEFPRADHNNMLQIGSKQIIAAMTEARR